MLKLTEIWNDKYKYTVVVFMESWKKGVDKYFPFIFFAGCRKKKVIAFYTKYSDVQFVTLK